MRKLLFLAAALLLSLPASAQSWCFNFSANKKDIPSDAVQVLPSNRYSSASDYGFDFIPSPERLDAQTPFFFSAFELYSAK